MPTLKILPLIISGGLIFTIGGLAGFVRGASILSLYTLWLVIGGILLAIGVNMYRRTRNDRL